MAKKTFVKKTGDKTFDPQFLSIFQAQVSLAPCFET